MVSLCSLFSTAFVNNKVALAFHTGDGKLSNGEFQILREWKTCDETILSSDNLLIEVMDLTKIEY